MHSGVMTNTDAPPAPVEIERGEAIGLRTERVRVGAAALDNDH